MKNLLLLLPLFLLITDTFTLSAQSTENNPWGFLSEQSVRTELRSQPSLPEKYAITRLDIGSIKNSLSKAPLEFSQETESNPLELMFPMPDHKFGN